MRLDRWLRQEQRAVERFFRRNGEPAADNRPFPSEDVGSDMLPQIKHIVVLMMENHSYDNYFGMLGKGQGFPLGPDGTPTAGNTTNDGQTAVPAHHFLATSQRKRVPTQSWNASHIQYNDGACDGFVRSVELTIPNTSPDDAAVAMGYWTRQDLPFYHGLADTFPLIDAWFGSCLGPTFPNRRFLQAGTANGLIDNSLIGLVDYPENGTIFDLLSRYGKSWVNYHTVSTTKSILKRALGWPVLKAFRWAALASFKWIPPVLQRAQNNLQFTSDIYPLGLVRFVCHLRPTQRFFKDAANGTLPSFSIVDPNFGGYSEENDQDIQIGEGFSAAVIDAVMHGPGWPNTVLIWTYDEHGGYYDHVPPPAAVAPDDIVAGTVFKGLPGWFKTIIGPLFKSSIAQINADAQGDRRYDRLGFRVPAVIVSPYARPGFVASEAGTGEVYDHTSILKLVETKWNLPPLTRRDAAAVAPLAALDLKADPAFLVPPKLPKPAKPWSG